MKRLLQTLERGKQGDMVAAPGKEATTASVTRKLPGEKENESVEMARARRYAFEFRGGLGILVAMGVSAAVAATTWGNMKHGLAIFAAPACGSACRLVRAGLKRPLIFLAVALLGLMLGSVQSAEAATACSVPSLAYPTIQSAVNDPNCNPINVAAGTYAEQVSINRTVTLNGAQAGVDARTRVAALESIIAHPCGPVQVEADNVVLDGFTVQGSTLPDPCFLSGIWTNPGFSGTQGGHKILNNIVQANISGIELDSTCAASTTLVQFNLIQNNNNAGPGSGNGIQTNFGLCKATIDSNKFSGHTNSSVLVVAPSLNLTVSNNELVAGTLERIVFANVSGSTVSGNVSTGSTSSGTIRLFGGDSNIAINSNTLLNGMRGIRVDDPFSIGINSGITAHQNCIKGNSIAGLETAAGGHLGTLNAESNWWGSSTGPTNASNPGGTGDAVVDPANNVDFTPWLTSPPEPPCPAAPPPPNTPGKVTGGGQVAGDDPVFSPTGGRTDKGPIRRRTLHQQPRHFLHGDTWKQARQVHWYGRGDPADRHDHGALHR